jgi:hypothetical protein
MVGERRGGLVNKFRKCKRIIWWNQVFVILMLLFGCTKEITLDDLNPINRGISMEALINILDSKPKMELIFSHKSVEHNVLVYDMITNKMSHTDILNGRLIETTSIKSSNYYFIFKKKSLIYWGFLTEIKRHEDVQLNELANMIEAELKKKEKRYADPAPERFVH